MSLAIASNERRDRLCDARSTRSVRLNTVSAESEAASNPPKTTSTTAARTKIAIIAVPLALSLRHRETDQEVALQRKHLLLLLGLGMVEPQQVKQTVGGEELELLDR